MHDFTKLVQLGVGYSVIADFVEVTADDRAQEPPCADARRALEYCDRAEQSDARCELAFGASLLRLNSARA